MSRLAARRFGLLMCFTSILATTAAAQECGGDLGAFLDGVKKEAVAGGIPAEIADKALAGARIDEKVLSRDRAQGVFKQTFLEFSQRTVSKARLDIGARKIKEYAEVFARAEQEFGVPAGVITAFWAMETDFGAVQGDFNTRNALVTLSHDCRRPELFRPQLIALTEMVQHGDLDPATNTGRPAASASARACLAASALSSPTRSCARWSLRRWQLPPNELDSTMSAPASMKARCSRRTRSG